MENRQRYAELFIIPYLNSFVGKEFVTLSDILQPNAERLYIRRKRGLCVYHLQIGIVLSSDIDEQLFV